MRLEKIKLAGFKSFVDPTSVALPGRLVGVVGPNGCGKSNIIDAVRWVMGESSAKHLRGSAMSDVIFNGSTGRKAVGLASIELIFDNSEGRLGGEYGRYSQISVKRQVSRYGQSQYFLNGTRCRRRDIMDLFLGTGLGPRSYAIIEQGTVSRFIEAKPEELRLFIEEAAGLSKYKERRHETELKLQHTRANLERVEDIRGELQKQVDRLARQARKAEKYRQLDQAIRCCHRELLAIQWRDGRSEYLRHQERLGELERALSQGESDHRQAETRREESREQVHELERQLQQQQARLYELNAEISRCNQALKHARQSQAERQKSLESWRGELERSHHALEQDLEQIEVLKQQRQQLEQELARTREDLNQASARQREAESLWQRKRRDFGRQMDDVRGLREKIKLLEVELRHNTHRKQELNHLLDRLTSQQEQMASESFQEEMASLGLQVEEIETLHLELREQLQSVSGQHQELRGQLEDRQQQLRQLEGEISRLSGRISGLETLQRHALGKDRKELQRWLQDHGWHTLPRLAETMEVEEDWQKAVETALGSWLEALYLDDIDTLAKHTGKLEKENLCLVESGSLQTPAEGSLAHKLTGSWNPVPLLGHLRCIDTLGEALSRRTELGSHECWITREGDQVGSNWLRINRQADAIEGVLERQKELQEFKQQHQELERRKTEVQTQQEALVAQLRSVESRLEMLRNQERDSASRQARLQAELQAAVRRQEENDQQLQQLREESEATRLKLQQHEQARSEQQAQLHHCQTRLEEMERELKSLQDEMDQARLAHENAAGTSREIREQTARLEASLEHTRRSRALLEKQLQRTQKQCEELAGRLAVAETHQAEGEQPLKEVQQQLEQLQGQRPEMESVLTDLRNRLKMAETNLRERQSAQAQAENRRDRARAELEEARLKAEAARVRLETVQTQVDEEAIEAERILATLEAGADAKEWQPKLEKLQREQARLGDVNLAAIEEHRLHSERLRFLDKQYEDLTASLEMLEKVIRTIDRETRSLFRETFEAVDGHFRQRFPALFGGGEARLEMTSDDPLEAGIRIMARPPGKRNSSIHLLSGGEKALTAVALVFSFFELKPAPFCMLDEVDAPLDEANVGRFCALLQSMSERVQFIFVTHNKTTMEIADQLIGVTMREPGVSRIVSVDLERAAEMAAA